MKTNIKRRNTNKENQQQHWQYIGRAHIPFIFAIAQMPVVIKNARSKSFFKYLF